MNCDSSNQKQNKFSRMKYLTHQSFRSKIIYTCTQPLAPSDRGAMCQNCISINIWICSWTMMKWFERTITIVYVNYLINYTTNRDVNVTMNFWAEDCKTLWILHFRCLKVGNVCDIEDNLLFKSIVTLKKFVSSHILGKRIKNKEKNTSVDSNTERLAILFIYSWRFLRGYFLLNNPKAFP